MVVRIKATVEDRDKGYKALASTLGEMGEITLGVQGEEALMQHPNSELSVGEIAAIHELGIGVPPRSWLREWMDENQARMLQETKAQLALVMEGKKSRNQALQELGYAWTKELRDRIWEGKITPPLSMTTVMAKGGETRPLLDTGTLMNSITYKVFLPMFKSIRDPSQRSAARGRGKKL